MLFCIYLCFFCLIGPFHLLKILLEVSFQCPTPPSFLLPQHMSHTSMAIFVQASCPLSHVMDRTRTRSSPGISGAPVPHTWLVLSPLFLRADMRSLQCHLPGSGNGPFYPHGESGSWGQSRVGSQSTFLQGERVRGKA